MAIINLTKETFKQQISEVDKPVIVDFWAPWCTYCRRIAPAFDKIASQQEDKLIFAKLDIDDAAEIAEEYGVDTIPTLIIFKNGEVLGSIVAPDSKAKIEGIFYEWLLSELPKEEKEAFCKTLDTLYWKSKRQRQAGFVDVARVVEQTGENHV